MCSLFCNKALGIERCHKDFVRRARYRARYRAGLADYIVADDVDEAERVLIHSRRIHESLDRLYQRLAAFAGSVEGLSSIFSGS